MGPDDCPECELLRIDEADAVPGRFYEGGLVEGIYGFDPALSKSGVVIAPRKHRTALAEMPTDEIVSLARLAHSVARAVRDLYGLPFTGIEFKQGNRQHVFIFMEIEDDGLTPPDMEVADALDRWIFNHSI